jgi:hypothetical protein
MHHLNGIDRGSRRMKRIEHTMVSVASWADAVSDELPWSQGLHFSHTPYRDCQPFDFTRDCGTEANPGRCIVSAIANYTERASSIDLSDSEREEALKFLIHLMADIHSPMHVAFYPDRGGNFIAVKHSADSEVTTLHEVWDRHIIDSMKGENGWKQLIGERRDSTTLTAPALEFPIDDPLAMAAAIATETAMTVTCNSGYRLDDSTWILSNTDLSESSYKEHRTEVLWTQLNKSAVRLASLLEAIETEYRRRLAVLRFQTAQRTASASAAAADSLSDLLEENRFNAIRDVFDDAEDPDEIIDDADDVLTTTEAPFEVDRASVTLDDFVYKRVDRKIYIVLKQRLTSQDWLSRTSFLKRAIISDHQPLTLFLDPFIPMSVLSDDCVLNNLWADVLKRLDPWHAIADLGMLKYAQVTEVSFGTVNVDPSLILAIPQDQDPLTYSLAEMRRSFDNLVVWFLSGAIVVTRLDFVIASIAAARRGETTYRAIFHFFEIHTPDGILKTTTYIDARLYDAPYSGQLMDLVMEFWKSKGHETIERVKRFKVQSVFERLCSSLDKFRASGNVADSSGAMTRIIRELNLLNPPRRGRDGLETIEVVMRLEDEDYPWTDPAGSPSYSFFEPLGFRGTNTIRHKRLDKIIRSHPGKRQLERMYGCFTMNRNVYAMDYISTIIDELVSFTVGRITFVTFYQTLRTNPNTNQFVVTFVPYGTGVDDDPAAFRKSTMRYLVVDNRVHSGSMTPIRKLLLDGAKRRIPINNLRELVADDQPLIFQAMTALSGYMDSLRGRPYTAEMSRFFKDVRPVEPAIEVEHPGILKTYLFDLKSKNG